MVDIVVVIAVGEFGRNDFGDEWCVDGRACETSRTGGRACEFGTCWGGDRADVTRESVVGADVGGVGIWTGGDDFGGCSSNVHGGGGIDDGD